MTEPIHFPNPPITEAIIDIQVEANADIPIENYAFLAPEIDGYPTKERLLEASGRVHLRADEEPILQAKQKDTGFKYISSDGLHVMQTLRKGFTFSRLNPYDCWENFANEAKRLWEGYRASVMPKMIKRVAVRYINRIDIPHDTIELKDYFQTSPELSPSLPHPLAGFFMQLQMPLQEIESMVVINQTIKHPFEEGFTSVLLDIDIFRKVNWVDDVVIWDFLAELRGWKNSIFLACITDRTKELFK